MNELDLKTNKVFKLKNALKDYFYILLVSPALFLLVNKYPYLLIGFVIVSIITGVVYFIKKRSLTIFHYEPTVVLIIIFVYFFLSYFATGQKLSNFITYQFLKYDGNFFFCYILFFIFSISHSNFKKLASYYFIFIFGIFTAFSIFGILEYFLSGGFLMVHAEESIGKMYFALNFAHNATGSVYAIVCIFLFIFFLKEEILKLKIFYLILFAINLLALFFTNSRSSYLGFFGAAIVVIWLHFKSIKKFIITIGAIIVVAMPLLFLTGIYKRVLSIFNLGHGTTIIRFYIWEKAWYLFSQSPLFGIGFARFNDIFNIDRGIFDTGRLTGIPGVVLFYTNQDFYFDSANVHNSYLQFLTETGFIGLCLVIIFWVLYIARILKAYNHARKKFTKKVLLSALSSIIILFIISFFENYISSTTVMIPISILVPLSIGLYWQDYNELNINVSNC